MYIGSTESKDGRASKVDSKAHRIPTDGGGPRAVPQPASTSLAATLAATVAAHLAADTATSPKKKPPDRSHSTSPDISIHGNPDRYHRDRRQHSRKPRSRSRRNDSINAAWAPLGQSRKGLDRLAAASLRSFSLRPRQLVVPPPLDSLDSTALTKTDDDTFLRLLLLLPRSLLFRTLLCSSRTTTTARPQPARCLHSSYPQSSLKSLNFPSLFSTNFVPIRTHFNSFSLISSSPIKISHLLYLRIFPTRALSVCATNFSPLCYSTLRRFFTISVITKYTFSRSVIEPIGFSPICALTFLIRLTLLPTSIGINHAWTLGLIALFHFFGGGRENSRSATSAAPFET